MHFLRRYFVDIKIESIDAISMITRQLKTAIVCGTILISSLTVRANERVSALPDRNDGGSSASIKCSLFYSKQPPPLSRANIFTND